MKYTVKILSQLVSRNLPPHGDGRKVDTAADTADNPDLMDDGALAEPLRRAFYAEEAFAPAQLSRLTAWLRRYITRACRDAEMTDFPGFANDRLERMRRANPKYVLRNYLAQQAIEALEQG
ncbi:MAG: hypothetical protein ABIN99_05975, partial [Nitrosospira sp.]